MKILIVEDNEYKRDKVTSFLQENFDELIIDEAYSYASGLEKALSNENDFIILDMSLPSFDKKDTENGGRFRAYGGKEIARKMKRKNISTPFVVLTQYTSFSDDAGECTIDTIEEEIRAQNNETFCGVIYYSGSESYWKSMLKDKVVANVQNINCR